MVTETILVLYTQAVNLTTFGTAEFLSKGNEHLCMFVTQIKSMPKHVLKVRQCLETSWCVWIFLP